MKLAEIAQALNTHLENGSPDTEITGIAGIKDAVAGQLTFVANPKYAAAAKSTNASAVIVAEDFPAIPAAMLRSKNPYLAFAKAIDLFHEKPTYAPGIHPTAVIHPSARVGEGAHIGPYVVINENVLIDRCAVLLSHVVIYQDATIGRNFFAHSHAVVREGCRLGDNVILHNGAVIGADGFGFAKDDQGHWSSMCMAAAPDLISDFTVRAMLKALDPNPVSASTRRGREQTSVMRRTSVSTSSRLLMPRSGRPREPAATPPPER